MKSTRSTQELNQFSREVVEIMPFIVREFAKREDNELTRGKISCPQMVALDYVMRKSNVTTTEIAHVLSIQVSSASVLVDRLVGQKMLSRKHDKKDRRVVWVSATSRGRKVVSQIMEQKRESIKAIFGTLTSPERSQYLSMLKKIKASLAGASLLFLMFFSPPGFSADNALSLPTVSRSKKAKTSPF